MPYPSLHAKMCSMNIIEQLNKKGDKKYYYYDLGRGKGQRPSMNLFIYVHPKTQAEQNHNKETKAIIDVKKGQLILDIQSAGTGYIPKHKRMSNFLDFYEKYCKDNKRERNKHLYYSLYHFKKFIRVAFITPADITEDVCIRYRQYLLDHTNGECPACYFRPFKRMLKSATKAGYFRTSPAEEVMSKEKKNVRRKEIIEVKDYEQLLKTPHFNEEIREAFILSCYQGLRHCDIKALQWENIRGNTLTTQIVQDKTEVPLQLTLHPISQHILQKRRQRFGGDEPRCLVFHLPDLRGCNAALAVWCRHAGVAKHITWHCARLSFSILLQDNKVDAVTVALLMGLTTVKYVLENYRRYRPLHAKESILKLPKPPDGAML